jgi:uncharacterized protein (TIGR00369 family)
LDVESLGSDWQRFEDGTFVSSLGTIYVRLIGEMSEMALQTNEQHTNLSGIVQGGVIMTLLDRVMGQNASQASGASPQTASMTVNFLAAVRIGECIVASCFLRRVGRTAIFADA